MIPQNEEWQKRCQIYQIVNLNDVAEVVFIEGVFRYGVIGAVFVVPVERQYVGISVAGRKI